MKPLRIVASALYLARHPNQYGGRGYGPGQRFIQRLWRSLKYKLIYPGDFVNATELFQALDRRRP